MLFRRRQPPSTRERIRIFFVPRRSFGRSLRYYGKRVLRLSAAPHSVAAGVAAGAAVSCTPFLGLHYVLAFALAFLLRGNLLAAALGTVVGNPLTFPFIWFAIYRIGVVVEGAWLGDPPAPMPEGLTAGILANGWAAVEPVLTPMAIGGVVLAVPTGLAFYALTRWGVGLYRKGRRERLAERRAMRQEGVGAGQ